jgi:hypothetical protein
VQDVIKQLRAKSSGEIGIGFNDGMSGNYKLAEYQEIKGVKTIKSETDKRSRRASVDVAWGATDAISDNFDGKCCAMRDTPTSRNRFAFLNILNAYCERILYSFFSPPSLPCA